MEDKKISSPIYTIKEKLKMVLIAVVIILCFTSAATLVLLLSPLS